MFSVNILNLQVLVTKAGKELFSPPLKFYSFTNF